MTTSVSETTGVERALDRLRDAGLKRTPQRHAILRTLASEPRHMTAQRIYEQARVGCPEIGLSTVYRTLGVLGQHRIVTTVAFDNGEASFALASSGHHHLLIC